MSLGHIQSELDCVACAGCCARIYTGCHLAACEIEIQENFCAEKLVDLDLCVDRSFRMCLQEVRLIMDIFRTNAENDGLSVDPMNPATNSFTG